MRISTILAAVVFTLVFTSVAYGQMSTAFGYQGTLTDAGAPANGVYALSFRLYDGAGGSANQIGTQVNSLEHHVDSGVFHVNLDFGADALSGETRWLEIEVNGFTLSPRTLISSSPYAVQTRGIHVDNSARVGIGTTSPDHTLDLFDTGASVRITQSGSAPSISPMMILKRAIAAPGIFSPLGSVLFEDWNDETRASISALSIGGSSTQLELTAGDSGGPGQMVVSDTDGVTFGPDGIKPPIAYGRVNSNVLLVSGSSNVSAIVPVMTGRIDVEFDTPLEENDIVLISIQDSSGRARGFISNGELRVSTFSDAGNPQYRGFSFVVYRP